MRSRAAIAFVAVCAAALLAVGPFGGEERYRLVAEVANANGLRNGSSVVIGGVAVGTVGLELNDRDRVKIVMEVEKDAAPVGRDVRLVINAANLLGQKQVTLLPGRVANPAPSGFQVPASRISATTDLDQVLAVLDPSTRARLAMLLKEAGTMFAGRDLSLRELVHEFPQSAIEATQLLDRLVADNVTLGQAIDRADTFISTVADRRRELTDLVDTLGDASESFVDRTSQLAATLDRAPAALSTAQRFLGELRRTATPLGPTARLLSAAAPPATALLDELEPVRRHAVPALGEARAAAPGLTRLAAGATPVLERAKPVAAQLASLSAADLPPVMRALDKSVDNIIAVVDNWSHAVQMRDRASHMFRGNASFTPDVIQSAIERLLPKPAKSKRRSKPARNSQPTRRGAEPAPARREPPSAKAPVGDVPRLLKPVKDVLDKVVDKLLTGEARDTPKDSDPIESILDFLLRP